MRPLMEDMSSTEEPDIEIAVKLDSLLIDGKQPRFCIIGSGHGGLAMAGYLAIRGYEVFLYNRTESNLNGVKWHGGVSVDGAVQGFGEIKHASSNMARALSNADIIMIVTPSTAHRQLAAQMASHLQNGQIVILNPGRTGGALEFFNELRSQNVEKAVIVAETQSFIFASRAMSRHQAHIYKIKASVPFATLPAYWIPKVLEVLRPVFPQFVAGTNVLATSLENIGAIFHPALTIMNAGWIEETQGNFEYYLDGITPAIALLLERIDAERVAVATELGVRSLTAREWLYLSYGSSGSSLYEAIQNTVAYKGIKAPQNIRHRYIFEDVPQSLVPLASLGAYLGKPTPTINMIVDLGSILLNTDYRAIGRTVDSLGLKGKSVKEIINLVNGD